MEGHDLVREIESRLDIVELVSESCELERRGNRYWGLCPFHSEKTPSFSVSREKQLFYCFGCHTGGNIFTYVMKLNNMSFKEALEFLASKAGLDLSSYRLGTGKRINDERELLFKVNKSAVEFFQKKLQANEGRHALEYLRQRGVNIEALERFRIGYAPDNWKELTEHLVNKGFDADTVIKAGLAKRSQNENRYIDFFRNRIIFPVVNQAGQVVGFGGRVLREQEKPKYINTPENLVFSKRNNLFGLYQGREEIKAKNHVLLVEGYMDCIKLHQYGIGNAVATLGTALTKEQSKIVKRMAQDVTLIYDGDDAGQREALRAAEILQQEGLNPWIVVLPGDMDPDEFIQLYGKEEFLEFIQNNRFTFVEYKLEVWLKKAKDVTWQDKIRKLIELFPDVAFYDSLMVQEMQIAVLARRLEIGEREALREFENWKKASKAERISRNRKLPVRNNRKHVEREIIREFEARLLGRIVNEPQACYTRLKRELGDITFKTPDFERVFLKWEEIYTEKSEEDLNQVLLKIFSGEEEKISLLAEVNLVHEENPLSDQELEDYIRDMKARQERLKWQVLEENIKSLEKEGNFGRALETIVDLGMMIGLEARKEG